MKIGVTILGCGSSGGVPRIGNDWGVCDPENPKNRRSRCGIHVAVQPYSDDAAISILIDTAPELREQLIRNNIGKVDAVLYTHAHADQAHGIDDLRALAYNKRGQMPVYSNAATISELEERFSYCFKQPEGSPYPPILKSMEPVMPFEPFMVGNESMQVDVLPIDQDHGTIRSLGFRIGNFAYCNDVVNLPEESLKAIEGVKLLIVDALRYTEHPTHAHLAKSLQWIERSGAEKAILTNLHIDMDYDKVSAETPDHVFVAYDGIFASI